MTAAKNSVLLSHDQGLINHWASSLGLSPTQTVDSEYPLSLIAAGSGVVWIDLSLPNLPPWSHAGWRHVVQGLQLRVIAASSNPTDDEGMAALDAGCAAYCHAFSDAITLQRIWEVVEGGNVWIGRSLMNRLLKSTARASQLLINRGEEWSKGLTAREKQVANLAANGASNQAIAVDCHITERTVKAHLSAAFEKLNVTDRLQLALRVHGIQ
jgi:DNA-binding NarL/FixJ family response regulator